MQVNKGFFHLQRQKASDSFGGDLQKRGTLRVLAGQAPIKRETRNKRLK
tara:strand:- start:270 stop:416 length:147 start_codon:yes stop_codon:yes gene_type:complete